MILLLALIVNSIVVPACFAVDYTGMWWDQNKQGMGVYLDADEGTGSICGAWYLYNDNGDALWLTFLGRLSGTMFRSDLLRFTGPAMGGNWDSSAVKGEDAGDITIDFSNPGAPVMTYQIDRTSGTLNLSRFSSEACAGSLWWDPQKPGQAVAHFHFPGPEGQDQTGIVWYVYDSRGNPVWFTGIGSAEATTFDAYQFTGPAPGEVWDASQVRSQAAGSITAVFDQNALQSQNMPKIDMTYTIDGIGGQLSLEPFICSSVTGGQ